MPTPSPAALSTDNDRRLTGRRRGFLWHSWRRLRKLVRLLSNPKFLLGLRHGVGASIEHQALLAGLPITSVVDVGANRGQFALLALALFPQAHIYAFEPTPQPLRRLNAWAAGETRLTVRQLALGAKRGEMLMHLSLSDDNSSLHRPTERQLIEFPPTRMVDSMIVPVARLDEVLSRAELPGPALLKIDVQGHEMEVLIGCEGLLDAFDHILVECTYIELYEGQALADQVITHLAERGFRAEGVSHATEGLDGQRLQADLLFSRPGHRR